MYKSKPNIVGIGISQVPTNAMLGRLAYQDSVSEINIEKIKARAADTAVDIFVYDTRKDSDGGAWRHQTQNTSWYNEGANEYRGARKEFPAVAVLVVTNQAASDSKHELLIYDADDPSLSLWMKFERVTTQQPYLNNTANGANHIGNYEPSSVTALNGIICVGTMRSSGHLSNLNSGLREFHFIEDACYVTNDSKRVKFPTRIAERQKLTIDYRQVGQGNLRNSNIRDVAMTVLPNAPVVYQTYSNYQVKLPVPTIAVATDGGVSILKEDGDIVDFFESSGPSSTHRVSFRKDGKLGIFTSGTASIAGYPQLYYIEIPWNDQSNAYFYNYSALGIEKYGYNLESQSAVRLLLNTTAGGILSGVTDGPNYTYASTKKQYATNDDGGISIISRPEAVGATANMLTAMITQVTKDYTTGFMPGDIKGVFLSDTDDTDVAYSTVADDWATAGAWTKQSSITISSTGSGTSGTLSITGNGTGSNVYFFNPITVEANTDYVVSITFGAENANTFVINTTQYNAGTGVLLDINALSGLRRGGHFNSGSNTTLYIQGWQTSTSATTITNLVIQKVAEKDRSPKLTEKKGLLVYGTVTKKLVADNAELVAYSGFSGSNYLEQPYNSDLDFGTGNWSFNFWVNPNNSTTGSVLMSRWSYNVDSSTAGRIGIYFNSGNVRFDLTDDGASSYQAITGSNGIMSSTDWHLVNIIRRGNFAEIWVDGIRDARAALTSSAVGSYTNNKAILEIGTSPNMGSPDAEIQLALIRISKTAPSRKQIKKMYETEKHLYSKNAKCTLYGTSDDVTAIAYDDSKNILHVGTSSGRSDFSDLVRINNTTVGITSCISASNGLVAEK